MDSYNIVGMFEHLRKKIIEESKSLGGKDWEIQVCINVSEKRNVE